MGFTFGAVIHVGLIFVYSARLGSLFFACECSFVLASFVEKTSLSPLSCLKLIECLKRFTLMQISYHMCVSLSLDFSQFDEFMCLSFQSYHTVLIVVGL